MFQSMANGVDPRIQRWTSTPKEKRANAVNSVLRYGVFLRCTQAKYCNFFPSALPSGTRAVHEKLGICLGRIRTWSITLLNVTRYHVNGTSNLYGNNLYMRFLHPHASCSREDCRMLPTKPNKTQTGRTKRLETSWGPVRWKKMAKYVVFASQGGQYQ